MLAVSPLRSTNDEREGEMESFSIGADDFPDFYEGNLLECIDFNDLFIGIHDGEILPDLEMDPEILAEFSVSAGEESDVNTSVTEKKVEDNPKKEEEDKVSGTGSGSGLGYWSSSSRGEEIVSKRSESVATNASPKEVEKGRKSSAQSKNPQGKRKVKVIRNRVQLNLSQAFKPISLIFMNFSVFTHFVGRKWITKIMGVSE